VSAPADGTAVVRLALAELCADPGRSIPKHLSVEVEIDTDWPDSAALSCLRMLAWRRGGDVAIVGTDPVAVGYVVGFLHDRAGLAESA
jgi:hypothetical protein